MKQYFEFLNSTKINAGHNAIESIGHELVARGLKKPLFVGDKDIVKLGLMQKVVDSIEHEFGKPVIFDKVPADSSLLAVQESYDLYIKNQCDCIIAVGGGSVIDSAKGVNILISEGGGDISKLKGHDRLKGQTHPLIVVPTTSGTGSEATLVAVIANHELGEKMLFTSPKLIPTIAVIDPEMTISMPAILTASTAMDALTHSIEAMSCLQKNPYSDIFAKSSIENIFKYLEKLLGNPFEPELRMKIALASTSAGIAFSNSMVGGVHAIGHSVGIVSHIHHGMAMAILLPRVMEFNLDKNFKQYSEIYDIVNGVNKIENIEKEGVKNDLEKANSLIKIIYKLLDSLNRLAKMPVRLSELNVDQKDFDKIASLALNDGALLLNSKDMNKQEVLEILNKSY
jgi:alcohol dehydrogenase